mmetsp:Transcript_40153/g.97631  ORF Transcript_40153/g.97631 Transcript_40153/m.97631 type:complete len:209 (+) Transcript_40153:2554-3180(+)
MSTNENALGFSADPANASLHLLPSASRRSSLSADGKRRLAYRYIFSASLSISAASTSLGKCAAITKADRYTLPPTVPVMTKFLILRYSSLLQMWCMKRRAASTRRGFLTSALKVSQPTGIIPSSPSVVTPCSSIRVAIALAPKVSLTRREKLCMVRAAESSLSSLQALPMSCKRRRLKGRSSSSHTIGGGRLLPGDSFSILPVLLYFW